MNNDYLLIARNFKQKQCEISEISEIKGEQGSLSVPMPTDTKSSCEISEKGEISTLVDEYMTERQEIHQSLGGQADLPGDYDHKATIVGTTPPYEAALARQEWLAKVDWRYGLRCGLTGHQCLHCRGIPCHDSIEWEGQ